MGRSWVLWGLREAQAPGGSALNPCSPGPQHGVASKAGISRGLCQVLLWEIKQEGEFQDGLEHPGPTSPSPPCADPHNGERHGREVVVGATGGSFSRRWMQ